MDKVRAARIHAPTRASDVVHTWHTFLLAVLYCPTVVYARPVGLHCASRDWGGTALWAAVRGGSPDRPLAAVTRVDTCKSHIAHHVERKYTVYRTAGRFSNLNG